MSKQPQSKMKQVKITYISKWSDGTSYDTNCDMCQRKGGLYNMLMLPTVLVKLEHEQYTREVNLCHSCITRGVKSGELQETNEMPPGCPFSMG
jgi:hypothetical protein